MAAKKIKLFVDAHVFDKEYQGAQTFIRELYTQLLANHPDLDIYFGAHDTANISKIFPGVPKTNILPYKKRRIGLLRYLFDIPAYIKKHRFDFAHFQYIAPKNSPGCKYVVTLHDVLFNDFRQDFSFIVPHKPELAFWQQHKTRAYQNNGISIFQTAHLQLLQHPRGDEHYPKWCKQCLNAVSKLQSRTLLKLLSKISASKTSSCTPVVLSHERTSFCCLKVI
jgi:hypothetical protein